MEEKIYESKSLRFICHAINIGMVDFESPEEIKIISNRKPGFIIKVIDFDIPKLSLHAACKFFGNENLVDLESNTYDYIVFSTDKSEENSEKLALINIPLFELILSSDILGKDETPIEKKWGLDIEEWDLILAR